MTRIDQDMAITGQQRVRIGQEVERIDQDMVIIGQEMVSIEQ